MELTVHDLAKMMDASCVRTYSTKEDIKEMVEAAVKYGIGQVTTLQCFIPYLKELLPDQSPVRIVGNVSFPSGSDSTTVKVFQAREMVAMGVDEIDMVMNIGKLLSGETEHVADDIQAVYDVTQEIPLKVIIEMSYLNRSQIEKACEICLQTGVAFVKSGTGWAEKGTSVEDIKLLKSLVGDNIRIKASGGIRNLDTMIEMIRCGANRFGVNIKSGKLILEDCISRGGKITI